jgi:eukaryotic-like serine/threonine-protein kinase
MALATGKKLGPYEILAPIGAGGMGEVYRARDTRLDRMVALKVLSRTRVDDPERKRRFLQEAKMASALNHPNIVTIYEVGIDNGIDYLAMELVPGKPLNRLIPRNGLPLTDIVRWSAQIADALSKAHGAGIIHRDLKPGNVMVTPEGLVKVLDFGLAKLNQPVESGDAVDTKTIGAETAKGTVLGTAAYMSPEQAEAKPLDARSDIFSFGAMLYEMATGQKAFRGDSKVSVLASVLRQDPQPVAELRPNLPPELIRIITRCLRKDPERRAQSMGDLRVALSELREESESGKFTPAPPQAIGKFPRRLFWFAVTMAVALLAAFLGWRARPPRAGLGHSLEPVPLTSYPGNESWPSFSPDGNQAVFSWDDEQQSTSSIYVQLIGSGTPLRLTNDPHRDFGPKWSPDGRSIAFLRLLSSDTAAVMLVPPIGGPERRVAQFFTRAFFGDPMASLCWTPDSKFLLVSGSEVRGQANRLERVSIDTGEVKMLADVRDASEGFMRPGVSPDGRTLAVVRFQGTGTIEVMSLSKELEPAPLRKIPWTGSSVSSFAWSVDSRDLIASFGGNNGLPLYRISVATGEARPLAYTGSGANFPAIAPRGGRLAFARAVRDTNIWQVSLNKSRSGQPVLQKLAVSSFRELSPRYSPDGKRLAFHSNRTGSFQIWTSDANGARAVQLTSMDPAATAGAPHWSPDGQSIAFDSNAGGTYQIYVINAEGGRARALTTGPTNNFGANWSHDGRSIYFTSNRSGEMQIWKIPAAGGAPLQVTRNGGESPEVSPDGRWLYYIKRGGADGVWKTPIDGGGESRIISSVYRNNFAATAEGLYFAPAPETGGTSSVRFLNFVSGVTSEIVKIEKPVDLGLAVSPDGRYLLFTQVDYAGQDLMLVEGFQ